jgi:hypothetical protein
MELASYEAAVLSPHAAREIARRGLPAAEVRKAIVNPAQTVPVRTGRIALHHRYVEGGREYLLRIFVDIDRDPPVIVTLYRTSKIEKYWGAP